MTSHSCAIFACTLSLSARARSFRELYKMIRHNPDLANNAAKLKSSKRLQAPKVEVLDLESLRVRTMQQVLRKSDWSNSVPANIRVRNPGRENPTIGFSVLK